MGFEFHSKQELRGGTVQACVMHLLPLHALSAEHAGTELNFSLWSSYFALVRCLVSALSFFLESYWLYYVICIFDLHYLCTYTCMIYMELKAELA